LAKQTELKVDTSSVKQGLTIKSDNCRLKQVIINLVSNAIKYTRDGLVTLSAETAQDKAKIYIQDTGVGMTRLQIDKLFAPFTKMMQNRDLNKEGVGLGLAISKNIVTALKGDIEATSDVNVGTKFTVTIPTSFDEKISLNIVQDYQSSVGEQSEMNDSLQDECQRISCF
jgi:signal transduction histidine kinase